jgi:hypothetical protein
MLRRHDPRPADADGRPDAGPAVFSSQMRRKAYSSPFATDSSVSMTSSISSDTFGAA